MGFHYCCLGEDIDVMSAILHSSAPAAAYIDNRSPTNGFYSSATTKYNSLTIRQHATESLIMSTLKKRSFKAFQILFQVFHRGGINTPFLVAPSEKWPILHLVIDGTNFTGVSRNDKMQILQFLRTKMHVDIKRVLDDQGRTPLILACSSSCKNLALSVIEFLIENEARVDLHHNNDKSVLHALISSYNLAHDSGDQYWENKICEIATYLLANGADGLAKNEYDESPLIAAAKKGLIKVVTLLERHMLTTMMNERQNR